jgi:hypothetical protein
MSKKVINPSKEQWDKVYPIIEKEIKRITKEQQQNVSRK